MLGKTCDLNPNNLQLYGILGSQLVAKCLHFQQFTGLGVVELVKARVGIGNGCLIIIKEVDLDDFCKHEFLELPWPNFLGVTMRQPQSTLQPAAIDPQIYALYDEYCHGAMDRREFLAKASAIAVGGMAMAQALFPRYANAQTISFTDPRIKASYVKYASPGGSSGEMRGYLVQPTSPTATQFPAVLVIHENRGLNPYMRTWHVVWLQLAFWHWLPTVYTQWVVIQATTRRASCYKTSSSRCNSKVTC